VEARAYKEPARSVMVKKIKLVMENVLLLQPSKDVMRVVKSVLTGCDLPGDVKYITKEMSFLQD